MYDGLCYFLCLGKMGEMLRGLLSITRAYYTHMKWQNENQHINKYLNRESTHCAECGSFSDRNLLKVIHVFVQQRFLKYLLCTNPCSGCCVCGDEKHRQDSCSQETYSLGAIMGMNWQRGGINGRNDKKHIMKQTFVL